MRFSSSATVSSEPLHSRSAVWRRQGTRRLSGNSSVHDRRSEGTGLPVMQIHRSPVGIISWPNCMKSRHTPVSLRESHADFKVKTTPTRSIIGAELVRKYKMILSPVESCSGPGGTWSVLRRKQVSLLLSGSHWTRMPRAP